jgi:hypothetical protein
MTGERSIASAIAFGVAARRAHDGPDHGQCSGHFKRLVGATPRQFRMSARTA